MCFVLDYRYSEGSIEIMQAMAHACKMHREKQSAQNIVEISVAVAAAATCMHVYLCTCIPYPT